MKQSVLFFVIIICITCFANAQKNLVTCGWHSNENLPHFLRNQDRLLDNNATATLVNTTTIYTLPVVVHVIHTGTVVGAIGNPNNTQINAMIANLNSAFRKKVGLYGGADMKIQFKLAIRGPGCTTTNGIVRINGSSITNYVTGGITNYNVAGSADEKLVKNLSRWPNTDYINIWIVNKINGNAFYPGGYAYFPEYNSALTDGLVLQASVVNGTNKTIVHEMGHFFGLYHTFYDDANETSCAANTDCTTQGDKVCDTEVHLNMPCSTANNSCNGSTPFIVADTVKHYTVLNNYMGYTDCQWMFTEGQKTRARTAFFNYRYGLFTSKALTAANNLIPTVACIPTATLGLSPYYGIEKVEFNTLKVYSNSSMADGSFYVDRSCNQSTNITQGLSYTLIITGSYQNPHRIKAFIDYNNDGDFDDVNETLLSVYTGKVAKKIIIPVSVVITGLPLRMRIVADNPALPVPTACLLHGTAIEGAGQVEDFSVIVYPPPVVVAND